MEVPAAGAGKLSLPSQICPAKSAGSAVRCSDAAVSSGRRHTASMWNTPQERHSKVASSGKPSNRAVRLDSCIGCAQLGQRGGVSAEFCALISHMVVVPGSRPARRADLKCQTRLVRKSGLVCGVVGNGKLTRRGGLIKLWQSEVRQKSKVQCRDATHIRDSPETCRTSRNPRRCASFLSASAADRAASPRATGAAASSPALRHT
jgi:hypothetical protein